MGESHFIEQVVGIDQLQSQTAMGWEVVERVEFDAPISYREQQVPPGGSYALSYTRTQIGRTVGFRIRLAADSPVATLAERVRALESANLLAARAKVEAEQALVVERARHQRTQADLKLAQECAETARADRERIVAVKRRLERDLGKIREHIGRKAFEEILPPTASAQGEEGR